MKEQVVPLLLSIVATLLNYIFISAITARSQQQTVQDFKTVLTYMMQELKSGQETISQRIDRLENDVLSQIKEQGEKPTKVIKS